MIERLKIQGHALHELSRCQMAFENPILREENKEPNVEPGAGTQEGFVGVHTQSSQLGG